MLSLFHMRYFSAVSSSTSADFSVAASKTCFRNSSRCKVAKSQIRKATISQSRKGTKPQSHKATNSQTHKLTNSQTHKLTKSQSHKVTNPQTHKLTNSQTHKLTNSQSHNLTFSPAHGSTSSLGAERLKRTWRICAQDPLSCSGGNLSKCHPEYAPGHMQLCLALLALAGEVCPQTLLTSSLLTRSQSHKNKTVKVTISKK
jgi:hypothetical protein